MIRSSSLGLAVLLTASLSLGQSSSPSAPPAAVPNAVGHGAFPVKVLKTLDSSKLKEGDTLDVETSGAFKLPDGTLVPKGSKLAGHVTTAKARSKGDSESQLTIAFDKLNIAGGKQLSIKGTVQAVFPPLDEVDPGVPGASAHQGGPGTMPTPDYKPTTDIKSGSGTESNGPVRQPPDPKSVGVHGFDNLLLNDGVLTAKGKNVKLGGGVQMIIHVDIFQ